MKKLIIAILLLACFSLTSYSQEKTKTNQRPAATYQVGSVNIAMWENTSKDGNIYKSFKVERNYQTKDGEWKSTSYFNETELLELRLAIDKAIQEQNIKVKIPDKKNSATD